ncbi:MAG TPA: ATP-binding protein [Bacteroidales bacterium]|nr:ATP-binding protein [Bacteroidales bacterium]
MQHRLKIALILTLLVRFTLPAPAQEFIRYNITDGLSGVEVTDIIENGNFLWISTTDGLNRFDGKHFKVFRHQPGNTNSLRENNTECLYFDRDSLLWIGLKSGGADIYNPRLQTFMHLNDLIGDSVPVRVISIFEDSHLNIWLGTWEEGLYQLVPEGKDKKHFRVKIHYPGYIVSSLLEKPRGFLRVGTYFGYFVYDISKNRWIENEHRNASVTRFLDDGSKNELWCSTWSSGLLKLNWDESDPGQMKIAGQYSDSRFHSIFRMASGQNGSLFLGTWGNGLKKMDNDFAVRSGFTGKGFSASLINSLLRDQYNNIWVGTYGEGLIRFSDTETGFSHFPAEGKLPAPATSLADLGNGNILVGTQGSGLYRLSLQDKKLIPLSIGSEKEDLANFMLSLYTNGDLVFAGHDGMGIPYSLNRKDEHFGFKVFRHDPAIQKVTSFFQTDDGTVWIGTKQSGLSSLKFDSGLPGKYTYYDNFRREEITGFAPFDDSTMVISSHSGLFRFNTKTGRLAHKGELSGELIYRLFFDNKNRLLWIGTSTSLMQLNYNADPLKAESLFADYGLPQGAVRSLIPDGENNLWFSIGERLFCYVSRDSNVFEIDWDQVGNHAILSSTKTRFKGKDYLVFGTTDNLIIVDPYTLLHHENADQIVLTELQIDHKIINAGDKIEGIVVTHVAPEYASSITLSYKSRWISLLFAESGPDLYVNRYQYIIEGFTKKWQHLDLKNPITFSQLNPGEYTLKIRKFDNSPESGICRAIHLTIVPPWWKTKWFRIIAVALIILIVILAIWLAINHNKKKQVAELFRIGKEKEQELLREKESFFTGLSHDLMTPFSLIISPLNDLLRDQDNKDGVKDKLRIIHKNASYLSDIFGTILDFKKAELNNDELKETKIEIVSFCRMVVNAFDYLATSRKISLGFVSSHDMLEIITDHVKIERILFNLISNAIKFTPDKGQVEVKLSLDHLNQLTMGVKDNGTGMELKNQARIFEKFFKESDGIPFAKTKGLGLGLYIVRKFTEKLGGTVMVKSEPGKGTEIEVCIPVKMAESAGEPETLKSVSGDKSTILIVEDNPDMRDYLEQKLEASFNVFTAENGQQAIAMIEKIMPEIIITDIMMPDLDGLSLTRTIKQNPQFSDIFVVILTALVTTDDELQGYQQGADLYIKKPFDGEALLNQMINIHTTSGNRKRQILSWLVSGEDDRTNIEFDPREAFLKRAMQVIEEHIMEPEFRIDEFASAMNVSKTVLHRKFRVLLEQSPNQFIRLVRLRKSLHLLRNTDHSVAEIAYLTGFNQSHYFIKCFREVYHQTPGEFRGEVRSEK